MPDDDFEADETMEDVPPPPSGGGGLPLMPIIAVVVVLAGVGGWFFMSGGEEEEDAAATEEVMPEVSSPFEKREFGVPVSLEDQTVNVMDGKRLRYMVYNVTLEAIDNATAAELEKRAKQLAALFIRRIGSASYEQLLTVMYRDTLEAELRAQVNGLLPDDMSILRIYFDKWITQ